MADPVIPGFQYFSEFLCPISSVVFSHPFSGRDFCMGPAVGDSAAVIRHVGFGPCAERDGYPAACLRRSGLQHRLHRFEFRSAQMVSKAAYNFGLFLRKFLR